MKLLEKLKNRKVIGYIIVGVLGLVIGTGIAPVCSEKSHDGVESKISTLETSVSDLESSISKKDKEIETLNAKVESAKPWFEMEAEEQRKIEEKIAKEKAEQEEAERIAKEKEAEEQAKKEAEEQARKEAQGVDTEYVKHVADSIITSELRGQVTNTTLESVRVNENAGTESNKDVVVLVNLSWSTKNLENTTRTMLEMYSDHLAAKLSSQLAEGSEIALFWKAEYTGLDIKHSYYIKNGNAYKQ